MIRYSRTAIAWRLTFAAAGIVAGLIAVLGQWPWFTWPLQGTALGVVAGAIAWAALLAPYTLDLSHRWGSPLWTGLAVAFLVWLVSVAGAVRLGERPGPAEKVLRRLTYRP